MDIQDLLTWFKVSRRVDEYFNAAVAATEARAFEAGFKAAVKLLLS